MTMASGDYAAGDETSADYAVTMRELDEPLCWRLLAGARFGRVGFVLDDEPVILPVNIYSSGRDLIFRTAVGSPLDRAADGRTVAFETDRIDAAAESGWSVLVRGPMAPYPGTVADPLLAQSDVHPWAPGERDRWIRIEGCRVTGRIVERCRVVPDSDRLPYMPPG